METAEQMVCLVCNHNIDSTEPACPHCHVTAGNCRYSINAPSLANWQEALEESKMLYAQQESDLCLKPIEKGRLSIGSDKICFVKNDGTLCLIGTFAWFEHGIKDCKNVKQVAVGNNHIAALLQDQTVVAFGSEEMGQCAVSQWHGILSIAVGADCTYGVTTAGNVLYVGTTPAGGSSLKTWEEIQQLAPAAHRLVGLRKDGTVTMAGAFANALEEASAWRDIVEIAATDRLVMGRAKDGRVFACSDLVNDLRCRASEWTGIQAITCNNSYAFGVTDGGRVLCVGKERMSGTSQAVVGQWNNIVTLDCVNTLVAGITSSGKLRIGGITDIDAQQWDLTRQMLRMK